MSFEVLKNRADIRSAKQEMLGNGIYCADRGLKRCLKRWSLLPGVVLGDPLKSWDVLKTVNFIKDHIKTHERVLDLGAYASELLPVLNRLGYQNLAGVDLNPCVVDMPYSQQITYIVTDMFTTPLEDNSCSAVTAISVIEHGFSAQRLLEEISRLLKPGGYFIASVDYWPEKIETKGITAFGMGWTIFSREELTAFFNDARRYGLELAGNTDFDAKVPTVKWMGRDYTFAWMVLRKIRNAH